MQYFSPPTQGGLQNINVLFVEGNASDARLIEKNLSSGDHLHIDFEEAGTLEKALQLLTEKSFDLILVNLFLPDCQNLETLTRILAVAPHQPVVILSDQDDESLAMKTIQMGAQDFLIKSDMKSGWLRRALFHAILRKRIEVNQRKNRSDLEQIRLRYHAVLRSTTHGLCMISMNWVILFHNYAFTNMFCIDPTRSQEYVGYSFGDLFPTDQAFQDFKSYVAESMHNIGSCLMEVELMDFDYKSFWAEISIVRMDPSETASGYVATMSDVTKRRMAEEQLRKAHSQMESQIMQRTAELTKVNESLQNEITIRKRMTEELDKTRLRLEFILSNSPAIIYTCESSGDYAVTYVSRNVKSILGYEPEDFTRKSDFWINHIHPDDAVLVLKEAPRVFEKGYHAFEYRFRLPDGRFRWIRDETRLTREDEVLPMEIIGFWLDITEQKNAEQKIRRAKEDWERTFNAIPEPIAILDAEQNILQSNNAMVSLMKSVTPGGLEKKEKCFYYFHKLREQPSDCPFQNTIKDKKTHSEEINAEHLGKNFLITTSPIFDDQKRIAGCVHVARDITERKQAENNIRKYQEHLEELVRERTIKLSETNKQLHELSRHLLAIREEERKSISREIHDDLGQRLTALKMDMVWCKNKAPVPESIAERVGSVLLSIDELMKAVQNISRKIRPGILDDLGLIDAMEWEAREFERRSGIHIQPQLDADIIIEPELSTVFFRIFQELLTNVARHAKATKVSISLEKNEDFLNLIVEDNGIGIAAEKIADVHSLGLLSIRERIFPWKGNLEISGSADKGTRVRVSVPLNIPTPDQGV